MSVFLRFAVVCLLLASTLLPAAAANSRPVVLFDAGHGERFLPQDEGPLGLSGLTGIFHDQGFALELTREPLTPAVLAEVDAVVVSGPFAPFAPAEIEALAAFVRQGGHLAVMLHVAPVATQLLDRFGVIHAHGVIHAEPQMQIAGEELNFTVDRLAAEPLLAGISHFALYGSWALAAAEGNRARIAASSSEGSWIDLNGNRLYDPVDARQSFGVVALGEEGSGDFVIFGDDAIFQNRYLTGGNRRLGENLALRLKP